MVQNNMTFVFFALILCHLTSSNYAFQTFSTEGLSHCLKEVGLEAKDVHKTALPNYEKDFLSCAFKRQGVQEADGSIRYDIIRDYLAQYYKPTDVEFILNDCKNLTENAADAAFLCNKCITQQIIDLRIVKVDQTTAKANDN